jgi:DNA mismatch repair ATPase MutL
LEIDVRIKDNGVKSVEVIDNGTGIAKDDYEIVGGLFSVPKVENLTGMISSETSYFKALDL